MDKKERKACMELIKRTHNGYLIQNLIQYLADDWKERHPILAKLGISFIGVSLR